MRSRKASPPSGPPMVSARRSRSKAVGLGGLEQPVRRSQPAAHRREIGEAVFLVRQQCPRPTTVSPALARRAATPCATSTAVAPPSPTLPPLTRENDPRTEISHGRQLHAKILEILAENRILTLATLRPDGWPQATTVGDANRGLTISFMTGKDTQKAKNLARDNRVSLTVDHDTQDRWRSPACRWPRAPFR